MSVSIALERPSAYSHATASPAVRHLPPFKTLSAAIYGLGGQGVIGLTRLLAQVLQLRYARTASIETRGIAQRRAPVRALVRAGAEVRSAAAPDALVNLVIALEASEALRAAHLLQPGSHCLLADLALPASVSGQVVLLPADVRQRLEAQGVKVITLQVQKWLAHSRAADGLVSTVAYGAMVALLELPAEPCENLLLQPLMGRRRDENEAAFRWGVAQFQKPALVAPAAHHAAQPARLHAAAALAAFA